MVRNARANLWSEEISRYELNNFILLFSEAFKEGIQLEEKFIETVVLGPPKFHKKNNTLPCVLFFLRDIYSNKKILKP